MKTILPTEYGLTALDPESYVAIAVSDLIDKTGVESLHLSGDLSKEYLGMLSLYAIRRANMMFEDNELYHGLVKLSYESFKPEEMSDKLVKCLTDIINDALTNL